MNTDDAIRGAIDSSVMKRNLPSAAMGKWESGTPGEGKFLLNDSCVVCFGKMVMTGAQLKAKHGIDGMVYHNSEPDFFPFAVSDGVVRPVKVSEMPTQRSDSYLYAERMCAQEAGVSVSDIREYMKRNGLTWHETGDRRSIIPIPTEINAAFKHTGGIGNQRSFEAIAARISAICAGGRLRVHRAPAGVSSAGAREAVAQMRRDNRRIRAEMFPSNKKRFGTQRETVATGFAAGGADVTLASGQAMQINAQLSAIASNVLGVGCADFSDFDPRCAKETVDALREFRADFPDVEIGYIGSIDHQISSMRRDLVGYFSEILSGTNGLSEQQVQAIAEHNADKLLKELYDKNKSDTVAWSMRVDPDEELTRDVDISRYEGIAINSAYASDHAAFSAMRRDEVNSGNKPLECHSPKATVDHELGHILSNALNAQYDPVINRLYSVFLYNNNFESDLSRYAAKNVSEFMAECYSEYRNNPTPRYFSQAVVTRLKSIYSASRGG